MLTASQQSVTSATRRMGLDVSRVFASLFHSFHRSCYSENGLRLLQREPVAHAVEISEFHQGEYPRGVLLEVPVANLGEAPQLFDHPEGMLDHGADRRPALVAGALGRGQRVGGGDALLEMGSDVALSQVKHGLAGAGGVLGEGRRRDEGGIDQGTGLLKEALVREQSVGGLEDCLGQSAPLQQSSQVQDRRLVRDGVIPQIDPAEAAHGFDVVEGVLSGRIREIESLLQKGDAQHRFQRHRRLTVDCLQVVRRNEFREPRPRHDLLHLCQKAFAPGELLLGFKGQRCKGRLLHSCPPRIRAGYRVCALDTGTCSVFPLGGLSW